MNDDIKIIENESVSEGRVRETPSFYENLTGSPYTDILDRAKTAQKGFLSLVNAIDISKDVPAFSTVTVTENHNITGQIPFVTVSLVDFDDSYTELPYHDPSGNLFFGDRVTVEKDTFYFSLTNNNFVNDYTVKFRAFIYKLIF